MKSIVAEFKKLICAIVFFFIMLVVTALLLEQTQNKVETISQLVSLTYAEQHVVYTLFEELHLERDNYLFGDMSGLDKAKLHYNDLKNAISSYRENIVLHSELDSATTNLYLRNIQTAFALLEINNRMTNDKLDSWLENDSIGMQSANQFMKLVRGGGYHKNRIQIDNIFDFIFYNILKENIKQKKSLSRDLQLLSFSLISQILLIIIFTLRKFDLFYRNLIVPIGSIYQIVSRDINEIEGYVVNSNYLEMNRLITSIQHGVKKNNKLMQQVRSSNLLINQLNFEIKNKLVNKSELLSMVSHDIRTPLNAVIVGLSLFEYEELPHHLRSQMEDINNGCHYLHNFVNSLLDFSKLDDANESAVTGVMTSITMKSWILNTCSLIKPLLTKFDMKTFIYISDDFPEVFITDVNVLSQVMINLFNNAVAHSGTKIIRIRFHFDAKCSQLHVSITDFGIGIQNTLDSNLFGRYECSPNSEGYGLGLYICRSLVESLGGKIKIFSSYKKGTVFRFNIPIKTDPDVKMLTFNNKLRNERGYFGRYCPAGMDSSRAKDCCFTPFMEWPKVQSEQVAPLSLAEQLEIRILIAEDVAMNVRLMKKVVAKYNFNACFVSNGIEVLSRIENEQIDLILMDIQMPLMDGIETTKIIKSTPSFAHIPIIGLSAQNTSDIEARCKAAGMEMLMSKPFDVKKLVAIIAALSGQERT